MAAPRAKISNIKTLAKEYAKGNTLTDVAALAKPSAVTTSTLKRALKEQGVALRGRGGKRTPAAPSAAK